MPSFSAVTLRAGLATAALLALVLAQMAALSLIYKHAIPFYCLDHAPPWFCQGASGVVVSALTFLGVVLLYVILRPAPFAQLITDAGTRVWPLLLNGLGFAITWVPLPWLQDGVTLDRLLMVLAVWALGALIGALGAALFLAPAARWWQLMQQLGLAAVALVATGMFAPLVATEIRPLWGNSAIADVTFDIVRHLLAGLNYNVIANADTKQLMGPEFGISVAPVCSGIEGMSLMVLFITVYLALFRRDLRFPQVLLLYPLGILASFTLNILRITVLMVIGLQGNPGLAVGGFHSHAGWILFILLAMGVILAAQGVPYFHRADRMRGTPPPWRRDPMAARLVPFILLVMSALVTTALWENPGLGYPLRAGALALALWVFWPVVRALPWRGSPDRIALAAGLAIAALWVLVPVSPPDGPPPFGGLSGWAFVVWMVIRGLGTTVLIPVVEELFFRDYLEQRLRLRPGLGWAIGAAVVSAVVFAALHGRWVEAFVAGLVLSWVRARRGRITDAIWAHGVANGLIFAVALALGQMHII